ncbi:S8 family serine peptidase [bacterium]|nr:S8 family serine peptidase [bacterium]
MFNRKLSLLTLSGTLLAFGGLAGCATTPGTISPSANLATPGASRPAPAVAGKVVVKMKNGTGSRAVQGMRMVQAVEGLSETRVYSVPEGSTVEETIAKLRHDPNVVYAEPDYIYHATDIRSQATTDDPMLSQLWGIKKIQAPEAWDTTTGDEAVTVAVVDTGVDYNHEDLAGKVIKGPDFGNNDNDPMDDQGHGTHVAGTIAGIGNNGKGVVGVAYKTKILAIKVLGSDGSGSTSAIAQGILKAQEMGARVINLSLGGPQEASVLKDALDKVTAKGVLCVVASGNDNKSTPNYPAAYPNALSVGATDQSDKRTVFSNYASSVDIAAPGLDILSSTGGSYKKMSGTSMASPHVAGAAALLLAKYPSLTPQQVRDALTKSGDNTSGFSNGIKRLNVARALTLAGGGSLPEPQPAPTPDPDQDQQPSPNPAPGRGQQPFPGQPGPGQPFPGQPGPGQPFPGQPGPGHGQRPGPGHGHQPGHGHRPAPGHQPGAGQPMPFPGWPFSR